MFPTNLIVLLVILPLIVLLVLIVTVLIDHLAPVQDSMALPRPLSDPLRGFRRFFKWGIWGEMVLGLSLTLIGWGGQNEILLVFGLALTFGFLGYLPMYGFVWRILPNQAVNAFYLRSFRNDRKSWPIRYVIQAELGRDFRLSGIRNPSRRIPLVLRFLLFAVFLFRSSTPKYMNLEAGRDWKARLWRSLGDARCAFVDLSDLTPFAEEEIHLCYHCLGSRRVLFIGDTPADLPAWRERLAAFLGLAEAARDALHIVTWDRTRTGESAFRQAVKEFATQLPPGIAGIHQDYLPFVHEASMPSEEASAVEEQFWWRMGQGFALAFAFGWLYPQFVENLSGSSWRWVAGAPVFAFAGYIAVLFLGYVIDCSSNRERAITLAWVAFIFGFPFGLLYCVMQVREKAALYHGVSQLSNIGLAFHNHNDFEGSLPEHAIYHGGKPVLSWRVAILPMLGYEALYRKFRLDEPWDSPHNKKLLPRMPIEYAPNIVNPDNPYATPYQVFVSPARPGQRAQALFLSASGEKRSIPRSIPDGMECTILVIEASRPVPWTKPEDLTFDDMVESSSGAQELLTRLGGQLRGKILVMFCDGSVKVIDKKQIRAEAIRAMITPDGGEPIDWTRVSHW